MRFGLHYLNTYVPEADGPVPQLYGHLTEQIYDYSLVRELYGELRASGWRPTR